MLPSLSDPTLASFKTATQFYLGSYQASFSTGYATGEITMSPTKNWVIYSSSDQYASYSLNDSLAIENNMTLVTDPATLSLIPKY